jgi:hypothetical protein
MIAATLLDARRFVESRVPRPAASVGARHARSVAHVLDVASAQSAVGGVGEGLFTEITSGFAEGVRLSAAHHSVLCIAGHIAKKEFGQERCFPASVNFLCFTVSLSQPNSRRPHSNGIIE